MGKFLTRILLLSLACFHVLAQTPERQLPAGMPTSGGYHPPTLSLSDFMTQGSSLGTAMAAFARSGDSATFRREIETQAASGDVGSELFLGEQYIPEQCPFEPNRDAPLCGKNGNEVPKYKVRTNPLQVPASYEDAGQWLQRASARGSGEASEVLAQLITRMLENGHVTAYSADNSRRLHALARSQGFDFEAVHVNCFQLKAGPGPVALDAKDRDVHGGAVTRNLITDEQLAALRASGMTGTLRLSGGSSSGDSTLLTRPESPAVSVSLILDHNPEHQFHLPIPAHRDGLFVQHGDAFVAMPDGPPNLARFMSLLPQREDYPRISFYIQLMDGGFSGATCGSFSD